LKSLDFKLGFDLRGAFSLEAAQPIPRKKVRAQRGPAGCFSEDAVPGKTISIFFAPEARNSAYGSFAAVAAKFGGGWADYG
jgi:hypothetical protein